MSIPVASRRPQRILLASLWMAGALLCLSGMAIAGRELAAELNAVQTCFIRSLTCLAVLVPLVAIIGFSKVRTNRLRLHVIRNVIHFGAQASWLFGVAVLPLAQVFAIEFTAPIWTALLASLFLGERLTGSRIGAIALGFAGILIILRPGFETIHPATLVVLMASVGFAITFVFTRYMSESESPLTVIFYMNLVQFPIGLALSLHDWTIPSAAMLPWIALIGVCGLGSHFCFAHALSLADAAVVTPIDFFRLPLIAAVGFLFYNEGLDILILVGGAVIFSGNLINLWTERRSANRPGPPASDRRGIP